MAYGQSGNRPQGPQNSNTGTQRSNTAVQKSVGATGAAKSTEALFSTGLFAPREGSKSVATVQLKEAVTIPAGSYINLYQSEAKSDKSPIFRMQIRAGELKAK